MVREALSGNTCKMEIYAAEGQKLEETVFSVLHVHQALHLACLPCYLTQIDTT
jgi:hypothetical protein